MSDRKYPIGTSIRFIHNYLDTGKTGTIVGYHDDKPAIYLPKADKHVKHNNYPTLSDGTKFTWYCGWNDIEVLTGGQLTFDFYNK